MPASRASSEPMPALLSVFLYIDVVLVVAAAAPVLALGAPVGGYAAGAGAWIAQRILARTDRRFIDKASTPRNKLGLHLFEAYGRIWLLAGAIVAAGVIGGRADGLTAALTICGAYSVAFVVKVLTGPPARRGRSHAGSPQRRAAQ